LHHLNYVFYLEEINKINGIKSHSL
jgi:hypothetical protein